MLHTQRVKKVAIIDIDLHHGNGTEEIVRGWTDVMYVSLHGVGDREVRPGALPRTATCTSMRAACQLGRVRTHDAYASSFHCARISPSPTPFVLPFVPLSNPLRDPGSSERAPIAHPALAARPVWPRNPPQLGEYFYPETATALQEEYDLVNVPLPQGTTSETYLKAFDTHVTPNVRRFEPDLIIVSCGFDACAGDSPAHPEGFFQLDPAAYGEVTARLVSLAAELCEGRLVSIFEGGYKQKPLSACARAHAAALAELPDYFVAKEKAASATKPPSPGAVPTSLLEAGQRVFSRYMANDLGLKAQEYPGTISQVNADGSYKVTYDDGDVEAAVDARHVRAQPGANGPAATSSSTDIAATDSEGGGVPHRPGTITGSGSIIGQEAVAEAPVASTELSATLGAQVPGAADPAAAAATAAADGSGAAMSHVDYGAAVDAGVNFAAYAGLAAGILGAGQAGSIAASKPKKEAATTRTTACKTCANCLRDDCGTCKNCVDKPKFGGPGTRKQPCIHRKCLTPTIVEVKPKEPKEPKDKSAKAASAPVSATQVQVPSLSLPQLPAGWRMGIDPNSGHPYYANPSTGETQWHPPPGTVMVPNPAAAAQQLQQQAAQLAAQQQQEQQAAAQQAAAQQAAAQQAAAQQAAAQQAAAQQAAAQQAAAQQAAAQHAAAQAAAAQAAAAQPAASQPAAAADPAAQAVQQAQAAVQQQLQAAKAQAQQAQQAQVQQAQAAIAAAQAASFTQQPRPVVSASATQPVASAPVAAAPVVSTATPAVVAATAGVAAAMFGGTQPGPSPEQQQQLMPDGAVAAAELSAETAGMKRPLDDGSIHDGMPDAKREHTGVGSVEGSEAAPQDMA